MLNYCRLRCLNKHLKLLTYLRLLKQYETNLSFSTAAEESLEDFSLRRVNPIGIQMLSRELHEQIFKISTENVDERIMKKCQEHLKKHGLWGRETTILPEISLKLPELFGSNIDEHFTELGKRYSAGYKEIVLNLGCVSLPPKPKEWIFSPGWTRYLPSGETEPVNFPGDDALVFDVEVCVQEGQFPTLATAASQKYWYSWCSEQLTRSQFKWKDSIGPSDLIPLEGSNRTRRPRIIVGHNVGFDRSFIKEQYLIQGSKLRFIDTISLHMCVSGLTSLQRALSVAHKSTKKNNMMHNGPSPELWLDISSLNNLADVYALYCDGAVLKKEQRDIFMTGTLHDIRDNFQDLTTYCSNDVAATHSVLSKVLPMFFERFPSLITFAGMLEMMTAYLPVNHNWDRYLTDSETVYQQLQQELKVALTGIANSSCHLLHDDKYKQDPWLWNLDWSVQEMRLKKSSKKMEKAENNIEETEDMEDRLKTEVQDIWNTTGKLYKVQPFMPGYPAWYRELCAKSIEENEEDWLPGPILISTQMRSVPKLLRLTWDGYPLHYDTKHGWGYLVPDEEFDSSLLIETQLNFPLKQFYKVCNYAEMEELGLSSSHEAQWKQIDEMHEEKEYELWKKVLGKKSKAKKKSTSHILVDDVVIPGCKFFKLPHKDGPDKRVGNPLSKDFLPKIADGTLKAYKNQEANHALHISKMISYWKNAKNRITSQMVVWLGKNHLPKQVTKSPAYEEDGQYGAILPRLIPAGTVTRRGVEPTWLTASNAYTDRVGSELKCLIQAPPGYHFVGADVDSQELWIATLLGDAHFSKIHGSTAIGWMTLQGKKNEGTDMHSKTAATVGITRDQAKVINYARIYGAGQSFAQQLLMQFNHRLTIKEAKEKAKKMYTETKGIRVLVPEKTEGQEVFLTNSAKRIWKGGSESHMFNKLEEIAHSKEPRTPVLGCRISRALEPDTVDTGFLTSRVNWVVQSSAVDYLHLMLVCMHWLMEKYNINGRFSISIHDEVRFLVASEDRYRAALALQITNLLTRSLFAYKLGMMDLPHSVAFFSTVDLDFVLRKEANQECVTPSNPHGLEKGYSIPKGEALDIYSILEKTGGSLKMQKAA